MTGPAILSIHDALVTFGKTPLFEDLSFNIHEGDKICLVGKNGAGKTTLMHMITGTRELDGGKYWQEPGTTIGYLQQDATPKNNQTVFDYIFEGLPKPKRNDDYKYMVNMIIEPLELNAQDTTQTMSGGQIRRAALARALVEEPDILLLDEPTNHLDLGSIEWLEDYLKHYRGTLLCVSHDKTFLANITNKIFWLDRGHIRVCPKGFAHFDQWSSMLLDQEARELAKREKLVAQELAWATTGVKARRKRNVRRVEEMKKAREKLKSDKSSYRKATNNIELLPLKASHVSKMIAEFYHVNKKFTTKNKSTTILNQFNFRIIKGDRIGILGKNGSGKTSFLKLLTGELQPDTGKIKRARNIDISYFDQKRQDLNPKLSLWETLCPDGGEFVEIGGKHRHVCSYLKDFMFDPKSAKDLVSTLSGGQQNRLMLAKVLANPGNLLILDEPTNDLDMETLDMLEDILANYNGTLFIVSHDRDFLDQTITRILAFEGNGQIDEYIGGYSDYLKESGKSQYQSTTSPKKQKSTPTQSTNNTPKTFTNKMKFELEKLPEQIMILETEITKLHQTLSNADLYHDNPQLFDQTSKRIVIAEEELATKELRWLELEEMQNQST